MITIQFFECLNVATQALCSSYLGAGDVANARGVINRVMLLGCGIGAAAGVAVFGLQDILVRARLGLGLGLGPGPGLAVG
jgi:Na+-driven multidrug efflux pump